MRKLLVLFAVLLPLACGSAGEDSSAEPLTLARGGVPSGWTSVERELLDLREAPPGWLRIAATIAPEDWRPAAWPGVHSTRIAVPGSGLVPGREGPHELIDAGSTNSELELLSLAVGLEDLATLPDGSFVVVGDELLLLDREGAHVSGPLEYVAWIERGARAAGRVQLHDATGEGFLLLPGERLDLDLPPVGPEPGAELTFAALSHGSPTAPAGPATTTLVAELDGSEVGRWSLADSLTGAPAPQRLALSDYAGGQLALRVVDGRGPVLILAPVLASTPTAANAALDTRPDIVLFLADTFRADNLAAWGAAPELTPHMNALADEGLVFTGARSAASWTLPAQASLLVGTHARQHAVIAKDLALPAGLPTLARQLSGAGYRTVAVTDGLFVSERHGLDQGFEVFLEQSWGKDFEAKTLARVRSVLELDDGRPLFLFVQSYRAHEPYVASPAALAALPAWFGADPDPADWDYLGLTGSEHWRRPTGDVGGELLELVKKVEALYRGGAHDLDRGFGQLRELLEERGLDDAHLILTSDHGEAFGEHGGWAHGTSVFEEQVRVPLIVHGPGIAAGRRADPVGLVDLAPTIARLAGLEPAPSWVGRDLLAGVRGEPLVTFECEATDAALVADDFAIYAEDHKVVGRLVEGELVLEPVHAFDLDRDPEELGHTGELDEAARRRAERLLDEHAGLLRAAVQREQPPEQLGLTEHERAELAAMGYTGN